MKKWLRNTFSRGKIKNKLTAAFVVLCIVAAIILPSLSASALQTVTFNFTGGIQTWTAPYTGTIWLKVWGAQGGHNTSKDGDTTLGGYGGYAEGTVHVTKGQTLYIYVGGQGQSSNAGGPRANGGWNGGGKAGPKNDSGGGGGATDVRIGGTSLNNRVIVAGGGGGAGNGNYSSTVGGSGGGQNGGDGGKRSTSSHSGTGATQTSGGTLGSSKYHSHGQFGIGADNEYDGGGGGGGWYGGSCCGCYDNGGGGGSGYVGGVSGGSMSNGVRAGNGMAQIQYYAPPSAPAITPSPTTWTKGPVTMRVTASGEAGISGIYYSSGAYACGNGGTVSVTANGWYSFYAVDNVGQTSTVSSYQVTNIDTTAPSVTFTPNGSSWATSSSTTIKASDSQSGVNRITYRVSSNGGSTYGSWTTVNGSSATVSFSSTGTYRVQVNAYDNVGNMSDVTSSIFYVDKTDPTGSGTISPSGWTNGSVTITVNGSDEHSGVASIKRPDGTSASGSKATYTVSSNGTYNFTVYDAVGNSASVSVVVNNIDKNAPSGTYTLSPSAATDGTVKITVTATDAGGSGVSHIRDNITGTSTTGSTATATVDANGTYGFTIYDNAGNSAVLNVPVSNIVPKAPSGVSASPKLFNAGMMVRVAFTNNEIVSAKYSGFQVAVKRENGTTYAIYSIGKTATYYDFDTTGLPANSKWKFAARVVSATPGQYSEWSDDSDLVEVNAPPTVSFSPPMLGRYRDALPTITVSTEQSDPNNNLRYLKYTLYRADDSNKVPLLQDTVPVSQPTATYSFETPPIGEYILEVAVEDTLSLSSTISSRFVVYENQAPVIEASFPGLNNDGSKTVGSITVTDPDEDDVNIVSVRLHNADSSVSISGPAYNDMPSGSTKEYDFGYLVDGAYYVDITASDIYGATTTMQVPISVVVPKLLDAGVFHTDAWLANLRQYNIWARAQGDSDRYPQRPESGLFFRGEAFVIKVPFTDSVAPGVNILSAWAVMGDGTALALTPDNTNGVHSYTLIMPEEFWVGTNPSSTKSLSFRIYARTETGKQFYVDKVAVTDGVEYYRMKGR